MEPNTTRRSSIYAATTYAALGWACYPLAPNAKVPLRGSHGLLDATTDPDVLTRVKAGLDGARHRVRVGGRPAAISPEKLEAILKALESGMSKAAICRTFEVKGTTLIETLSGTTIQS